MTTKLTKIALWEVRFTYKSDTMRQGHWEDWIVHASDIQAAISIALAHAKDLGMWDVYVTRARYKDGLSVVQAVEYGR